MEGPTVIVQAQRRAPQASSDRPSPAGVEDLVLGHGKQSHTVFAPERTRLFCIMARTNAHDTSIIPLFLYMSLGSTDAI